MFDAMTQLVLLTTPHMPADDNDELVDDLGVDLEGPQKPQQPRRRTSTTAALAGKPEFGGGASLKSVADLRPDTRELLAELDAMENDAN